MIKAYSNRPSSTKKRGGNSNVVVVNGGQKHWLLILLSSLSLLVTPILVAIISSNSSQSSTNKDYVALAVNILNSKTSTPENRKWALKLLATLSPVQFSQESEKQLEGGSGLTSGPIKIMPMYGPKNPLIKRGEKVTIPCAPIKGADGAWTDSDINQYVREIGRAYAKCALQHQYALSLIDVLQSTYKTSAQIETDLSIKNYPIYNLRTPSIPSPARDSLVAQ